MICSSACNGFFLLLSLCNFGATINGADLLIRSPEFDGRNAAAFLASLCRGNPSDILKQFRDSSSSGQRNLSFLGVQKLAKRFGCETEARALSYTDLTKIDCATIVLLRHKTDAKGEYMVLLAAQPGSLTLLRAGMLAFHEMTEDEFRHRWTGHALIPIQSSRSNVEWWGLMAAICGVCTRLAMRSRRFANS